MPSINKIRASNIYYDNRKYFYDDIVLNVEGKSFLIELVNGGGKTLLAQLIMQTILPKSHFVPEHPLKELFGSNNKNTVIHSLVEWKLDEGAEIRYLLTGFCAKRKESGDQIGTNDKDEENILDEEGVDYFNYACFYNKPNKYSIEEIPLCEEDLTGAILRMNYNELKKYLREPSLNQEDILPVIFSSSTQRESLLRQYKINVPEWNMIKDVNRREANAAEYLKQHRTSKKFIQDFLIPKIEELNHLNMNHDYQTNEQLADSLLSIQATFKEYLKRKENIRDLDTIEGYLREIVALNNSLRELYEERRKISFSVIKGYNRLGADIKDKESTIKRLDSQKEAMEQRERQLEYEQQGENEKNKKINVEIRISEEEKKKIQIIKKAMKIRALIERLDAKEEEKKKLKEVLLSAVDELIRAREKKNLNLAENKYLDYLDQRNNLTAKETLRDNERKSNKELSDKVNLYGSKYKQILNLEINKYEQEKSYYEKLITEIDETITDIRRKRDRLIMDKTEHGTNIVSFSERNSRLLGGIREYENKLISNLQQYLDTGSDIQNNFSGMMQKLNLKKQIFGACDKNYINITLIKRQTEMDRISSTLYRYMENSIKEIEEASLCAADETENVKRLVEDIQSGGKVSEIEVDRNNLFNAECMNLQHFNGYGIIIKMLDEETTNASKVKSQISSGLMDYKLEINNINNKLKALESGKEILTQKRQVIERELEAYVAEYNNFLEIAKEYGYVEGEEFSSVVLRVQELLKAIGEKLRINQETKRQLQEEIEELTNNKGITLTRNAYDCFELIRKKYNTAILGIDYIKDMNQAEKSRCLENSILIPYSILLNNEDFKDIQKSSNSFLKKFKNAAVPILNVDAIRKGISISNENMYFITKDIKDFLDEERIEREIQAKRNELEELNLIIASMQGRFEKVEAELSEVREFAYKYAVKTYSDHIDALRKIEMDVMEIEEEAHSLIRKMEEINNNVAELETQNTDLNAYMDWMNEMKVSMGYCRESHEGYLKLISLLPVKKEIISETFENIMKCQSEVSENESKLRNLELKVKECEFLVKENENLNFLKSNERKSIAEKRESLIAPIENLAKERDEIKAQIYDVVLEENDTLGSVKAVYRTTLKSAEGKLTKLEEIEEDIKQINLRCDQIVNDIKAYGYILEHFNGSALSVRHSDNELENDDHRIEYQDSVVGEKEHAVQQAKNEYSVQENEIIILKSQLLEDEGAVYDNIQIPPEIDTDREIQSIDKKIADLKGNIEKINDHIKALISEAKEVGLCKKDIENEKSQKTEELMDLKLLLQDVSDFTERENISLNITDEIGNDIEYIRQNSSSDRDSKGKRAFKNNKTQLSTIKSKYNRIKDEASAKLAGSAFNFNDDFDHLLCPENMNDCLVQLDDICNEDRGYISLLIHERKLIQEGIVKLEEAKEHFIEQCSQKCQNTIEKIYELEEFSKVNLMNSRRQVIKVNLSPLEPEQRKEKLRYYINRNLKEIDDNIPKEDKLKILSKVLLLKNLVAQSVVNMDNCSIEIFKIDMDGINGRPIKWEEAGSNGQTNSMLICVFMCIMAYLRKLSSYDVYDESRKLIYFDSPFNGTQAPYLWVIPNQVIRNNNIQFMCTAYDVPQELTSMFDVRYKLGFKKINKNTSKVNIVSEDIRGSADNSRLGYDHLIGRRVVAMESSKGSELEIFSKTIFSKK